MIKIEYPPADFRTKDENGTRLVFDELRRSWLKLTPEEWVRQNFVRFLISRNIPPLLIALEKQIRVGEMLKRFDILVYDENHRPWMMVECKSMDVPLRADVLHQVLRYNIAVPVKHLVITNGTNCVGYTKINESVEEIDEFPAWGSGEW